MICFVRKEVFQLMLLTESTLQMLVNAFRPVPAEIANSIKPIMDEEFHNSVMKTIHPSKDCDIHPVR